MTKYDQPEHTSIISRHHHPLYRTKWYYYGLDPSQKSAKKRHTYPIVSENKNDPQHKKILQKQKPNFVPENKNDPQHTQILQSKPIFYSREQKMICNTQISVINCKS